MELLIIILFHKNNPVNVSLRYYSLINDYEGYLNQPVLILAQEPVNSPDTNFDRIKNALSIT